MRFLRVLSAVLLLLGTSYAQKAPPIAALPKDMPQAGSLKPVVSPTVEQHRLPNGMSVWLVQRSDLPKVGFTLVVRGGDSFDPASAPGLAQLMARCLPEGTNSKSSREIAQIAQGAGGDLLSVADADSVKISLDTLSEHALDGLSLVADVAQNANFPDQEVALAKSNMQDELRSNEATPRFLARRAWYEVTYGDHPYSIIAPTMKALETATTDSLRTLYAQTFRPDQTLLVVVGSFDRSSVLSQIDKVLGGWKAGTATVPKVKEPAGRDDHKIYYIARPESVQTTMLIGAVGLTSRNPDEPYLNLANTVYGGSFGSRLIRNIREDKGYTYSPYSYITSLRWSGAILTSEDVRNAVTGASLKETFYEMRRLSTEPPTTLELEQAKRYLIGNTALQLQSRAAVADLLSKYWVEGQPADHLTQEMISIQEASVGEVAKAAAKYLSPDRMTVVAVGEKAIILEQLKPFGMEIAPAP